MKILPQAVLIAFLWVSLNLLAGAGDGQRTVPGEKVVPKGKLAVDPPLNLVGIYHVKGTDGDSTPYEGVATIHAVNGSYYVQWLTETTIATGVGRQEGEHLTVGWTSQRPGGVVRGFTKYKIDPSGKVLQGHFHVIPGPAKAFPETLQLLKRFGEQLKEI